MDIITLITDWNNDDYYIGMVQGYLLSNKIDVRLIEISHQVPLFDTQKAGFIARACFASFPEGTFHAVTPRGYKSRHPAVPLAVKYKKHWFFGYDNGAFLRIFEQAGQPEVWELQNFDTPFPELDLLIKPILELLRGKKIESLGVPHERPDFPLNISPKVSQNSLIGEVVYINGYGNAVTDISHHDFETFVGNKKFKITLLRQQNTISKIDTSYDEDDGELFAIFNTLNMLEIGQINYRLDQSIGLEVQSKIRIQLL
jgi:hypothetical protein